MFMRMMLVFSLCFVINGSVLYAQISNDLLHQISDQQAALYESVAPAVVRIITSKKMPIGGSNKSNPDFPFQIVPEQGSPFEFFFNIPQQPKQRSDSKDGDSSNPWEKLKKSPPSGNIPDFVVNGVGSGVVVKITEQGSWVLTNCHVLEDADQMSIAFRDEIPITELNVVSERDNPDRNVFKDEKSDLALIFLSSEVLENRQVSALSLGDSDALRVGELVYTLGAPLNRDQTFCQGIVSAKDRVNVFPIKGDDIRYEGLIQTTAFINVGNSGGPLLDVDGRIVGINVAIQTAGGLSNGFIGIGFAIPSNRASFVIDQLIQNGEVIRGWLGVSITVPDNDDRKYFDLPLHQGVKIAEVGPDSPAAQGGLQKNDIVLEYYGKQVHSPAHLQELVANTVVDSDVPMSVLREGEQIELTIRIGRQPEDPKLTVAQAKWNTPELGATLRNLDEEEKSYFENAGFTGVIIDQLNNNGPLGKKRIPLGSLITEIENRKIDSVEVLAEVLEEIKNNQENDREVLVMVKYVPAGSDTEEFQVIRLDIE